MACERNLRYNWSGDGAPEITQLIFSDIAVDGTDDKSGPAQNMDLQITPDAVNSSNDNADHNRIYYFWHQGYADIKYANTVITYIDQPGWDTTDQTQLATRNDLLGQAYFHRSYRYSCLHPLFSTLQFQSPSTFSVLRMLLYRAY